MPDRDTEAMGLGDFYILDRNGCGVRDDIDTVNKTGIMPNRDANTCTAQLCNHSRIA
jgi:hypothetical protein